MLENLYKDQNGPNVSSNMEQVQGQPQASDLTLVNQQASFLLADVLELIFFFNIPKYIVPYTLGTAPTNVSQVNSHWRTVALSSRRLWATLLIDAYSESELTRNLTRFALFLERCGPNLNLTLDFIISAHPGEFCWGIRKYVSIEVEDQVFSTMEAYLDLLLPRRSSWRRAALDFKALPLKSNTRSNHWPWKFDNLKSVEYLYLNYPLAVDWSPIDTAIVDVSASKRLEAACIEGQILVRIENGIMLEKLVCVHVHLTWTYSQGNNDWYRFLEHAPNLEALSVVLDHGCPLAFLKHQGITLPRVHNLKVIERDAQQRSSLLFFFLSSITCPELLNLKIVSEDRSGAADPHFTSAEGLAQFFHRSACPLDSLLIDTYAIFTVSLSTALSYVPTLRHFELRRIRFYIGHEGFVASLLTSTFDDAPVTDGSQELERAPNFETFVFRDCVFGDYDRDSMVAMIAARWSAEGSKLRRFQFKNCDLDGFDSHPKIKRIRRLHRYSRPRPVQ